MESQGNLEKKVREKSGNSVFKIWQTPWQTYKQIANVISCHNILLPDDVDDVEI